MYRRGIYRRQMRGSMMIGWVNVMERGKSRVYSLWRRGINGQAKTKEMESHCYGKLVNLICGVKWMCGGVLNLY